MEPNVSSPVIIEHKAYARIGLLGNPSDVYYGRTISLSIENFWACVRLEPSDDLLILPHPTHDFVKFGSLSHLVNRLENEGYYGGVRLLMAICKVFTRYCKEQGIHLHDRNFSLSYDTNIPRQEIHLLLMEISAVRPHDSAEPIQVRVIRNWIPYGKRQEFCYLFVDKHGDAIEAIGDLNHKSHFESRISVHSCYTVSDYLSDTARPYMNIVPHTACIRLGLQTSFVELDDDTIPNHYYNFVNYDRLKPRLNNHQLLTDYIGRMDKVSPILNRGGTNMLKITLQDQSGNFIEATLWEHIAFSFPRQIALQKPQPVIIALTSMKVSEYKVTGMLQLGSTNATTTVINPEIEDMENVLTRFRVMRGRSRTYPSTSTSITSSEVDINRSTIEQLLEKSPKENYKIKFTCLASIKDIDSSRKWFYKACTECRKKVLPKEEKFACLDHGEIQSPRFMYAVNATLSDDTSSVAVVLFNEVMTTLLGIDCNDLVVEEDSPNPNILPTPLRAIRGKVKIFQLMFRQQDSKEQISFTINNVFEPNSSNIDIPSSSSEPSTKVKKRQSKRSYDVEGTGKKKQKD